MRSRDHPPSQDSRPRNCPRFRSSGGEARLRSRDRKGRATKVPEVAQFPQQRPSGAPEHRTKDRGGDMKTKAWDRLPMPLLRLATWRKRRAWARKLIPSIRLDSTVN